MYGFESVPVSVFCIVVLVFNLTNKRIYGPRIRLDLQLATDPRNLPGRG